MMKLLWLLWGVLASLTVGAQWNKGTIQAGGTFGFEFKKSSDKSSQFEIGLSPQLGFFVSKHFVAGPQVYIGYSESRNAAGGFHSMLNVLVGPFFRYYAKIGERVAVFGHVSPLIGGGNERFYTDAKQPYIKTFQLQWEAGPGLAIWLNPNVALTPAVYYRGRYYNNALMNTNTTSVSATEHGVIFNLGLQVFLTKTKKQP
ncbi:MAG: hypothetical protein U0T84_10535 [Chitinophagales bacterium]